MSRFPAVPRKRRSRSSRRVAGLLATVSLTLPLAMAGISAGPTPQAAAATGAKTVHAAQQVYAMAQVPGGSAVGVAAAPAGGGWEAFSNGTVEAFGGAPTLGDLSAVHLAKPIVGIAATPSGDGYWLIAGDGGIFTFGDARFFGSTGGVHLAQPIVAMAATPSGDGYWLVASDGGIFTFGDARFFGSTGGVHLTKPVVGMAATGNGDGYWLVASDGGIFTFGNAGFDGSTGGVRLARPIIGMSSTSDGAGYWLVASDGGVFTFGDAGFLGSLAGSGDRVSGIAPADQSDGYWLVTANAEAVPFIGGADASSTKPTAPGPTSSSPEPTPALPESNMHLIYDDEFNGSSLSSDWSTCFWYAPKSPTPGCSNGTEEGEWYSPNNDVVHNGELSLTAEDTPVQGVNQSTGAPETYNWTSGMADTYGKFSFSYGYVEWRAQIPAGAGLWPALWLLPENNIWPPEIDALEMVGSQPNVWTGTYIPPTGPNLGHDTTINGLYSGWHTFGVDWEPNSITWYVDGQPVATSTTETTDTPMYLVMDLAVGGAWPGYPNASTPFPSSLNIDYVRVWQSSAG